jgi:hypothetical protein
MSRRFETHRVRAVQPLDHRVHRHLLTRAELQAFSRRATATVDCTSCGQPAGQRCRSGNGNPCPPHFWRLVRRRKLDEAAQEASPKT